ncbi:MAG: hypothetical protein F6K65_37475, partial [Moorea sp. SIO3C2]|nr:hypothetical protein [Moorena sp. SIO3C2]
MENDVDTQLKPILALVRQSVSPDRLNTIQESVFSGCWLGQTYQEIADDLGYDAVYIRGIGSQLWQQLSKSLGEKITKSNFQTILQQRLEDGRESVEVAHVAERPKSGETPHPSVNVISDSPSAPISRDPQNHGEPLSASGGQKGEGDDYVFRPPNEERCYSKIEQQGALIRIKAPRQLGKTSFMTKVLGHAKERHFHSVVVSLRLADTDIFTSLDRVLQWFCAIVDDQLGLESDLEKQWKPIFGSNYNCTHYIGQTV